MRCGSTSKQNKEETLSLHSQHRPHPSARNPLDKPLFSNPSFYHLNFVTFLKGNADSFVYYDKALQGLYQTTCGQFCLCISFMRCRGISLEFIVNQFSKNKNVNGRDVIQFVKSHYDLTVAFCKNVLVQTAVCLL